MSFARSYLHVASASIDQLIRSSSRLLPLHPFVRLVLYRRLVNHVLPGRFILCGWCLGSFDLRCWYLLWCDWRDELVDLLPVYRR